VYQLQKSGNSWLENTLYAFSGDLDGGEPFGGLVEDSSGNFYGTTSFAGAQGYGTIFELAQTSGTWTLNTLYTFQYASDGGQSYAGLISDSSGNLYGTTSTGGPNNAGTVFELKRSGGSWVFNVVYAFSGTFSDGPRASLIMDSGGNLYGTTFRAGAFGAGSVFKLTKTGNSWTYSSLHDFTGGSDGAYLYSSLALDSAGNLYGTTYLGGTDGQGVIFEITP
jgi:uncharacterized repeat protein (TIGR03803 family)